MSKYLNIPFLTMLLICCLTFPAGAQPPDFVSLAEQLKPSVVNIGTAKTVKPRAPQYRGPRNPGGNDLFEEFFDRFFREAP